MNGNRETGGLPGTSDTSILNDLIAKLWKDGNSVSSAEIGEVINRLLDAQRAAEEREGEEKRRQEQEEAKRSAEEERLRREEHVEAVTSRDLPLDWENAFAGDSRTQGVHAESISDGLVLSLANLARVDIEYISSVTGEDYKTVIGALKGSIYQNPETWEECFYKGWETAEEYLSGNLMRKWRAVQKANKEYKGYFEDNIKAISKVLPATVTAKDIYITLGSPWVPVDIIDDFVNHIMGFSRYSYQGTKHDELTGTWEVTNKSLFWYRTRVEATHTYGTERMEALYILEKTLNMKTIVVTDEVKCTTNSSGKKRVVNKAETVLALEKQEKMIKEFQRWVWKDKARKERLERIFEERFGCVRRRIFDGSFLEFPTMSSDIRLYPYQKNAVARILFTPNTLLAHDVGSGKTYVMIAAGMELKRMGLSSKNLYVVPNNIVGQWKAIFGTMYPNAKLLCVEPKNFTKTKREDTLKKVRDDDYDGIIMAYSCFEQIPLSKEFYMEKLRETRDRIFELTANKRKATSKLGKKLDTVVKELSELAVTAENVLNTVCFDELGMNESNDIVNILFLDEISAAPQSVQAAAYQITLDRVVGEHKLPENCIVIAAGNRITDKSVAFKMPKALANRLLHIEIEGSFQSWKKWAICSGINDKVIGFLSFRQNYLMGFDSSIDDLAFATPRSWEMVSNLLNHVSDDVEKMYSFIAGLVGTGVAVELRTWAKVYKQLPEIAAIFEGKMPPLPSGTDAMYALVSAMTAYAREHKDNLAQIENSVYYAERMPPDFATVLMKDYMYIEKGYKETLLRIPAFAKWLHTKGKYLNGSV